MVDFIMVIFFLSGSLKDIIFEGRRLLPNPYLNGQELKSKGRNYMENKDLVRILYLLSVFFGELGVNGLIYFLSHDLLREPNHQSYHQEPRNGLSSQLPHSYSRRSEGKGREREWMKEYGMVTVTGPKNMSNDNRFYRI